jgi:hypothetical protein
LRLTIKPARSRSGYISTKGAGASSLSSERLFELDLGGEAVTIAPDRQNRQLAAAMSVSRGAVLRLESPV